MAETEDKKYYTSSGEEYNPDHYYVFRDSEGNTISSMGDNGYVWEAIEKGVPLSVNSKGEWYVTPYLEVTPNAVVSHMPDWFKKTPEYKEWNERFRYNIQPGINKDTFNQLNTLLGEYGRNGLARTSAINLASSYGVTDGGLQNSYLDTLVALNTEGENSTPSAVSVWGKDYVSVADAAREFKNLNKEDQSANLIKWSDTLSNARKNAGKLSLEEQKAVAEALKSLQIINEVAETPGNFGAKGEFDNLLEASARQKANAAAAGFLKFYKDSFWMKLAARVGNPGLGIYNIFLKPALDKAADAYSDLAHNPYAGSYLSGTEGFVKIGLYTGTAGEVVSAIGASMTLGELLGAASTTAAGSKIAWLAQAGQFAKTFPGSMVTDFALHDIPIDILNAFSVAKEKGWGKAVFDPDETQKLIPVPFVNGGGFGPEVPAGLVSDIIGDAVVDLSIPAIGLLNNVLTTKIDNITNGMATRIKEKAALTGLKLRNKFTEIPILGTGWKKMMNGLMGPENANLIREAAKASIADNDMFWYRNANNILTLKNHGGAEEIAGFYEKMLKDTGVFDDIRDFIKNAKTYGGLQETKVKWTDTIGGEVKNFSNTVPDILPVQVKQGLLDIERLAELKGKLQAMGAGVGGIIQDVATQKEIAKLEARVRDLPQNIKDFAEKFVDLNKKVSQLGVFLGITNENWLKAMQGEATFSQYMVRQVLTPTQNMGRAGSAEAPAILNKGRKGYYAKNYLDPVTSLNMKVTAMGKAYAWNEQAKAVAAMQKVQGKITAGVGNIEAAQNLAEVNRKIANVNAMREKVGYDGVLGKLFKDNSSIVMSVNKINELLNAPQDISLKSIYSAAQTPAIAEFVNNFETGRIRFADGVKEMYDLTDFDAAYIIKNTYSLTSLTEGGAKTLHISAPDNVKAADIGEGFYNAGVAPNGTAYKYTVKDGQITELKEITDANGMAETIRRLGGVHKIDNATVEKIGIENSRAINRAIIFYRDNMPNLPMGSTFRCQPATRTSVMGWIPYESTGSEYGYKLVNGRIEAEDFPVYLAQAFYKKGAEERTLATLRESVAARHSPKNATTLEYVPIHENGHATMARLGLLRANEKIANGTYKVHDGMSSNDLGALVYKEVNLLQDELAKRALTKCGIKFDPNDRKSFNSAWQQAAYDNISKYAGSGAPYKDLNGRWHYPDPAYQWETFSEAVSDVWANDSTASRFSAAIVEGMREEAQKFSMAASPKRAMQQNDIYVRPELFKGEQYNFPDGVKTNKQKAEWLAKWRKKNPYMDAGVFGTDEYVKANLWDTFFKKEIEAFDPHCKTSIPDKLVNMNGDFIENLSKNTAKQLVEEIKKASVGRFDENLAMAILSKNVMDSSDAINNLIVGRVSDAAHELATKMDGGDIPDNYNIALLTLYQDGTVKQDMTNLLGSLVPDVSLTEVATKVESVFNDQIGALKSYEALPVDMKNLVNEQIKLRNELEKGNNYAQRVGKKMDDFLHEHGYASDVTQVIHYMEGGEDVYVVVADPVVTSILRRPNDYANNGIIAETMTYAANTWSRLYRLGTTGINPVAFVRNILRDPIQATITAGFNPLAVSLDPQAFYHSLRRYGLDDDTIKMVDQKLRTWASTGTMTSEIRRLGGNTPGTAGYRNKAEKFAKKFNKLSDNKIINALETPLETWESMFRNQVAQQSFEKAMRRTGGDINKSLASAMFDASNATTNFSHSLGMFRRYTSTVPYLSSAINGVGSFWRLFTSDPIGMITRITGGILVPVMAITAWNLGSEERRKQYLNLPEWYRDGHLVLIDMEGNVLSLPLPDEITQYSGTARRIIEYMNEANQYSLASIAAQGAFGMLPFDTDGFFAEDGSLNIQRGVGQMFSGIIPQAATAAYEIWTQEEMYTGMDISNYTWYNKLINSLGNIFGSSFTNIVNDIGFLCGASNDLLVGKTTADTLARDLFGIGFDNAKQQFMQMIGRKGGVDAQTGRKVKATGLYKEYDDLQKQLIDLDKDIALAETDEERENLKKQKAQKIEDWGNRVARLTNNYMNLFTITGGLEYWQQKKIVGLLNIGFSLSTADEESYQGADSKQAGLDEYSLARQRYVDLGLPAGASEATIANRENGYVEGSLALQDAINRFYGSPKQAAQDFKNAITDSNLKDLRESFYEQIQKIYDDADANGTTPDYDQIEKIQAQYLQSVDATLVPIINQYGQSILNNNDFIDEVRDMVNGMIPSDDWRQSTKNAKRFLSTKEYPTATVDVKKWLKNRYSSGMRNRGINSDPEVTQQLESIAADIDAGRMGAAKGKIQDLKNGINKSQYYISSQDYQRLAELNNMVK